MIAWVSQLENGQIIDRRATRLKSAATFLQRALLVSVVLNIAFLVVIIRGCVGQQTGRGIIIDGELVCLVRSEKAAREVHEALLKAKRDDFPGQASFKQTWEDQEWPAEDEKILTNEEAIELLKPRLDVLVEGFAIQISGRDVVVLQGQEAADEVLTTVKAKFLTEGETRLEPQRFQEEPVIAAIQVPPEQIDNDIQGAAEQLLRGTTEPTPYVVKSGDAPHRVATTHDMTVEQLYALNRGLKDKAARNDIHPGDTWQIATEQPNVVVITKKESTRVVPIPFEVLTEPRPTLPKGQVQVLRPGKEGQRKEWIQGVWRNGKLDPASVTVIRTEELVPPEPKRVIQGTG